MKLQASKLKLVLKMIAIDPADKIFGVMLDANSSPDYWAQRAIEEYMVSKNVLKTIRLLLIALYLSEFKDANTSRATKKR